VGWFYRPPRGLAAGAETPPIGGVNGEVRPISPAFPAIDLPRHCQGSRADGEGKRENWAAVCPVGRAFPRIFTQIPFPVTRCLRQRPFHRRGSLTHPRAQSQKKRDIPERGVGSYELSHTTRTLTRFRPGKRPPAVGTSWGRSIPREDASAEADALGPSRARDPLLFPSAARRTLPGPRFSMRVSSNRTPIMIQTISR
jgi:hypothetical protein